MLLVGARGERRAAVSARERACAARARGVARPDRAHRRRRLLALTIGVVLLLAALGIALALVANGQLTHNRHLLLDEVGPARRTALVLENALVNEETGVRGFALTGEPSFLEPYDSGLRAERARTASWKRTSATVGAPLRADVARVRARADAWRARLRGADADRSRTDRAPVDRAVDLRGKRLFDAVRASLDAAAGRRSTRSDAQRAREARRAPPTRCRRC